MNQNITAIFTGSQAAAETDLDNWVHLESEAVPFSRKYPSVYDINQMVARVMDGISAVTYLADACPYVTVKNGVITVTLDFYVWPSSLDLPYSLTTPFGNISGPEAVSSHKSTDVVFLNTTEVDLGFLFDGAFTPETPVFNEVGSVLNLRGNDFVVEGSTITTEDPVYVAGRASGVASGYKHSIAMEVIKAGDVTTDAVYSVGTWAESGLVYDETSFPVLLLAGCVESSWRVEFISTTDYRLKDSTGATVGTGDISSDIVTPFWTIRAGGWTSVIGSGSYLAFSTTKTEEEKVNRTGYSVTNLENEVTVSWASKENELQTEVLQLEIPECVGDILEACEQDVSWLLDLNKGEVSGGWNVYFSSCSGKMVAVRWEE